MHISIKRARNIYFFSPINRNFQTVNEEIAGRPESLSRGTQLKRSYKRSLGLQLHQMRVLISRLWQNVFHVSTETK